MVWFSKFKVVQKAWNVLDLTEAEFIHCWVIQNHEILMCWLMMPAVMQTCAKTNLVQLQHLVTSGDNWLIRLLTNLSQFSSSVKIKSPSKSLIYALFIITYTVTQIWNNNVQHLIYFTGNHLIHFHITLSQRPAMLLKIKCFNHHNITWVSLYFAVIKSLISKF